MLFAFILSLPLASVYLLAENGLFSSPFQLVVNSLLDSALCINIDIWLQNSTGQGISIYVLVHEMV